MKPTVTDRKVQVYHKKATVFSASILLLAIITVCGTAAYLIAKTDSITNTFEYANVDCKIEEDVVKTVKKNVNVINKSNIPVYIRVRLITYRVNDAGEQIGGIATIPSFTPGAGWFKKGDFYYYRHPVGAQDKPSKPLIGNKGINLTHDYKDADGGSQVVEVFAEAIQSQPRAAVEDAWSEVKVVGNQELQAKEGAK